MTPRSRRSNALPVAALLLVGLLAAGWAPLGDTARASASPNDDTNTLQPVQYVLRFPEPHTHYVEVEVSLPTADLPPTSKSVDLRLATWTPGSYLIREFARHVEDVSAKLASDDKSLSIVKTAKNRWTIPLTDIPRDERVIVVYRVYCREMSVRTNWVEADFAILNGAPTFVTLLDDRARPHQVTIDPAAGWKQSVTGLPRVGDAGHRYQAESYDQLVDSPILIGNPAIYEFEVGGKPHVLANLGEGGIWEGARSVDDVKKIVDENLRLWGELPYEKYVFLNLITESGGGLEHSNSTLMMTSRWRSRVPERYQGWLGLVSHEFFHTWNVKRLRPIELGPFDYENEVYTESLWVAEGITSYYDDLNLCRAGLTKQKKYLTSLSKNIGGVETTPGRKVRPLSLASYDAWIRHYRPDENSRNTTISYYTKGAVVSFLLDVEVRRLTNDSKSLDDVMRLAYSRYSGERGFHPSEFYACASETAGVDLTEWFKRNVESTDDLQYAPALEWLGLRFKDPAAKPKKDDDDSDTEADEKDDEIAAWIGLRTKSDSGRLVVSGVTRETPAHAQGFNTGDEIIAIDDYRDASTDWDKRLKQYRPGDRVTVLIARREQLMRLAVTFGEKPKDRWKLEVHPEATDEQKAHLESWLGQTRTAATRP